MTTPHGVPEPSRSIMRLPILWVTILAVVVVSIMIYSTITGSRIAERYVPLVDAAMEIKLEAAIGHLWFEEIISGDKNEDIDAVWDHLDQSAWYARAMLEGGETSNGVFVALRDPVLRREIETVLVEIASFRMIAEERWAAQAQSGVGSDIDQRFDAVFEVFLDQADQVEAALRDVMAQDLRRFRVLQAILIAACIGAAVVAVIVLGRYNRGKSLTLLALRESELRFHELFEHTGSGVAVYEARDNGEDFVFVDLNLAGERASKVARKDLIGRSVTEVFPGIRTMGLFEVFQRVWRTGHPERLPVIRYGDDRMEAWFENYVYKLASGEVVAVHDNVTEWKQSEDLLRSQMETRELLLRELNHRVRNNLSSLLSIIDLSHADARSIDDLAESIRSRVQAIASIHSILAEARFKGGNLKAIVRTIVHGPNRTSIVISGPDITVPLDQVQGVGLVVNELTTNSIKYGAMSADDATVQIDWTVSDSEDGKTNLTLRWTERGGPPIETAPKAGTGTNLIVGLIRSELQGQAELTYPPEGAKHTLHISLAPDATSRYSLATGTSAT